MFDEVNKSCILLDPPKPIDKFMYLCDRKYHTELIEDLYQDHDKYGIILITGEEVKFYSICGTEIRNLDRGKVRITKNQKKGGQSAPRFGRIRDNEIQQYISHCCELSQEHYLEDDIPIIKGLVIAGNADKKDRLYENIHFKLKEMSQKMTISDKDNIHTIVERCKKIFDTHDEELNELNEFYEHINRDTNRGIYGIKQIMKSFENYSLQKVLIHEKFDKIKYHNVEYDRDYIKNKCEETNCQYIEILSLNSQTDELYKGYGGIVGISWY